MTRNLHDDYGHDTALRYDTVVLSYRGECEPITLTQYNATLDRQSDVLTYVATEAELLRFANRVRAAGGADVLEALLPSEPHESQACLIANALNFGCQVRPEDPFYSRTGLRVWQMILPDNLTDEQIENIQRATRCPIIRDDFETRMVLPEMIGAAAAAFDAGLRFRHLNKRALAEQADAVDVDYEVEAA